MKTTRSIFLLLAGLYGSAQNEPRPKTMKMPADVVGENLDSTTYSGTYSGKSLFFHVTNYSKTTGTCIKQVAVNGQVTTDELNTTAFEIDFKNFKMKIGDKIIVKIIFKKGCEFKCLNEEVLHNGKPSK